MAISGVQYKDIYSYDGTRIRYQDIGEGPVVVLANGLGGTFEAWSYMIEHLRKKYRIISWDYRGLYDSEIPPLSRLTVADHVEDLHQILKKEKIKKALFCGWSMGTQVIFEFTIRHPEFVLGLVPICGAAGAPFETALYTGMSRYMMPALFHAQRVFAKPFGFLLKRLVDVPGGFEAITATGLFWRSGEEVIRELVGSFAELDFEAYAVIMLEIGRHDARNTLDRVTAPVLMVAATRDFFTPVKVAELVDQTLPDCQLHVLEGATHYAPLEYPEKINELLDKFIDEKVKWPAVKSRAKKR